MKITIIHGQSHKGSTYNMARMLAGKLGGEVKEFFLPRDLSEYCVGCTGCIMKSEKSCPHYERLRPITEAIDSADVLIFASPVYVFHVTGAMKTLLDHYAYRWMLHRPEPSMFVKQAVCISTAAGSGTKTANKDIYDSLFWWGVGKIYSFSSVVAAMNWESVSNSKKAEADKALGAIARKIRKNCGRVKPGLKTRGVFFFLRRLHKAKILTLNDRQYWKKMGWLDGGRPWKK